MMEIRKRRPFHDEDAMSAMNDIMFFLLLFFLIIATMSNANIIKISYKSITTTKWLNSLDLTLQTPDNFQPNDACRNAKAAGRFCRTQRRPTWSLDSKALTVISRDLSIAANDLKMGCYRK